MVVSGGMNKTKHFLLDSSNGNPEASFLAAESSAGFLNFVRKAAPQKTPLNYRSQAPGRPAPIDPKLPNLDGTGTLNLPPRQ